MAVMSVCTAAILFAAMAQTSAFSLHHPQFEAHGLIIEERGFLDVYPYANWSGKVCPYYCSHEAVHPTFQSCMSALMSRENFPLDTTKLLCWGHVCAKDGGERRSLGCLPGCATYIAARSNPCFFTA